MTVLQQDLFSRCLVSALSTEDIRRLKGLRVPLSTNEPQRIRELRSCGVLDTASETIFDRYTSMCARVFKAPISLLSLVDVDRQWFKSKIGLDFTQTHRDDSFCSYTILDNTDDVFVVPDAHLDSRFLRSKLVTGAPCVRFYAGAAVVVDGQKVGTLCIMDTKPRWDFSQDDAIVLRDLAKVAESILKNRKQDAIDSQNDLVRMVCLLLQNVDGYVQKVVKQKDELRLFLDQCDTRTVFYIYQLRSLCTQLKDSVHLLNEELEAVHQRMTLMTIQIYLPHTRSIDLRDSLITAYRYAQDQCIHGSGIYSNHFDILGLQDSLHMYSYRMVEVVEKLKHSLRWHSSQNRISWLYDNYRQEQKSLYSRLKANPIAQTLEICWGELAYYLPYNILDLALFALLSHICGQQDELEDFMEISCRYAEETHCLNSNPTFSAFRCGVFVVEVSHKHRGTAAAGDSQNSRSTITCGADDDQSGFHLSLRGLLRAAGGGYSCDVDANIHSIRLPCVCLPYEPPLSPLSSDSSAFTEVENDLYVDSSEDCKLSVREGDQGDVRSPAMVSKLNNTPAWAGGMFRGFIRKITQVFSSHNKVLPI
eukprot:gene25429-30704_t